jgi:TetR/AcrR family acrAB operon transcriptional repressor
MSSPSDAASRLLASAAALGAREGSGALSMQGIADEAGVSKASVLYHFDEKAALLVALHAELSAQAAARLRTAAREETPLDAWRALVHAEVSRGELALLASLASDAAVRSANTVSSAALREEAATELSARILTALELTPRISVELLGRLLLRHLDGVVVALAPRSGRRADAAQLDDELDAFALAFLALGE